MNEDNPILKRKREQNKRKSQNPLTMMSCQDYISRACTPCKSTRRASSKTKCIYYYYMCKCKFVVVVVRDIVFNTRHLTFLTFLATYTLETYLFLSLSPRKST